MKRTLDKVTIDRSLQRRWSLSGAEPVRSYLPPYTEFAPADLRIWWSAESGQAPDQHTLSIYAWPAEREQTVSAHWTGDCNNSPVPKWIRELSDVVHEDLIANAASSNTGAEDNWAYCASSRWSIEDSTPIPPSVTRTNRSLPLSWTSGTATTPGSPATTGTGSPLTRATGSSGRD